MEKIQATIPVRILVCISQKKSADICLSLAKYLGASSKILCIGYLWSHGSPFLSNGLIYKNMPIFNVRRHIIELVFSKRKFRAGSAKSTTKSDSCFRDFIREELNHFRPDVVIIDNPDSFEGQVTLKLVQQEEIPSLSLHTSFMKSRFIVRESTDRHWDRVIPLLSESTSAKEITKFAVRNGSPFYFEKFSCSSRNIHIERLERLIRQLPLANRKEPIYSIILGLTRKFHKITWFPGFESLGDISEIENRYVMVLLHQPVFGSKGIQRYDLIRIALQCIPQDTPVVIRPHPSEIATARDNDELKSNLASHKVFISRSEEGPTLGHLILKCKALITLSSASGFEALLQGKPVFTLLPTFYSRAGCAEYIAPEDIQRLKTILSSPQIPFPNPEIVRSLADIIAERHSFGYPEEISKFADMLRVCAKRK